MKKFILSVLLLTACGSSHDSKSVAPTTTPNTNSNGLIAGPAAANPSTPSTTPPTTSVPGNALVPTAPNAESNASGSGPSDRYINLFTFETSHYPIENGENLVYVQDFEILSQSASAIAASSLQALCEDKVVKEIKHYFVKTANVSSTRLTLILNSDDLNCAAPISIRLSNKGNVLEDKGHYVGIAEVK